MRRCSSSSIGAAGRRAEFRFDLARKAFAHTGGYDTRDCRRRSRRSPPDAAGFSREARRRSCRRVLRSTCGRSAICGTARIRISARRSYAAIRPQARASTLLQGKELSYTNLLDLDAAARIVLEFDEPAAAVIKHTNPCGAATGSERRRCLRARARCRFAAGVRRHRRTEPTDRCGDGASDRVDLHRGGHRAGRGRRGAAPSSRRSRTCAWSCRTPSAAGGRCRPRTTRDALDPSAACSCRRAIVVREAHAPWPAATGSKVVTQARSRPRRSGRRCGSPGASART